MGVKRNDRSSVTVVGGGGGGVRAQGLLELCAHVGVFRIGNEIGNGAELGVLGGDGDVLVVDDALGGGDNDVLFVADALGGGELGV